MVYLKKSIKIKTTNNTVLISGGSADISPAVAAEQFVAGLEQNEFEIRIGQTEDMYRLYLSSPEEALKIMNQTRVQEMTS